MRPPEITGNDSGPQRFSRIDQYDVRTLSGGDLAAVVQPGRRRRSAGHE